MLNNNNKKLLLFDYDGTLVDSAQMIIDGTIEAFNRCGLATPEPEEIKAGIGKKLESAIERYLPVGHKGTLNQVIRHYRQWYFEKDLEEKLIHVMRKIYRDNSILNKIKQNQKQYSDKDVFNKLNFNIEKIINEKN